MARNNSAFNKSVLAAAVAGLLAVGMSGSPVLAQNQPGGDRGGDRGRGNFDPAKAREEYYTRMKERLGATDDEWKVLQPRIEKVSNARRAADSSSGRVGSSGRGPGGGDSNRSSEPQSPLSKAAQDLRTATENKDTPPAEVTAKLAAFREARARAEAELAAAQKELVEVLTPRQEAILVSMGSLK